MFCTQKQDHQSRNDHEDEGGSGRLQRIKYADARRQGRHAAWLYNCPVGLAAGCRLWAL